MILDLMPFAFYSYPELLDLIPLDLIPYFGNRFYFLDLIPFFDFRSYSLDHIPPST